MENQKKIYASQRNLLGSLAKWATAQSPYPRPDNIEVVLDKFHEQINPIFGKEYCLKFTDWKELESFLKEHLYKIPEFMLWNERKNGNKSQFGFVSAGHHDNGDVTFTQATADNDFIDLDALIRNTARDIINDQLD